MTIKLTFWQRLAVKGIVRKARKLIEEQRKAISELNKNLTKISKEQKELLEKKRQEVIESFTEGEEGLLNIYDEIVNEEGEQLTKERLGQMTIEELTDLYEDMINQLEEDTKPRKK